MIARLRGRPVARRPDGLVLDVNGVGYLVAATPSALRRADGDEEVAIETYLHVREDALQLYGFAETAERELFEHLLSVSGVGPKVALAIVSGSSPEELRRAIVLEDTARFEAIPGIGKKTAQRVVLELKEKMGSVGSPGVAAVDGHLVARDALVELGYSLVDAERALADVDAELPAEERVRRGAEAGCVTEAQFLAPALRDEEDDFDRSLRPRRLEEFVGQERLKEQLEVVLAAANTRGEALDHVLLVGPPGLGKTSLAHIVREELGAGIRTVAGPALERKGDLAAILTSLEARDVLFVDEIHRLNSAVEEILYPALEDFRLDIVIGQGPAARTLTLDLPPFTLVGATTRTGLLTTPLRDRFGMTFRLSYYEPDELAHDRPALGADPRRRASPTRRPRRSPAARAARRASRTGSSVASATSPRCGTPGEITAEFAREALELLEVDEEGLERTDRELLEAIVHKFAGGPVGLSTLAVSLGEEPDTIEDVYEPYLLQLGFIQRTPRGRIVTDLGLAHVAADQAARADSLF